MTHMRVTMLPNEVNNVFYADGYSGYQVSNITLMLMLLLLEGPVVDDSERDFTKLWRTQFLPSHTIQRKCTAYSGWSRCYWYQNLWTQHCCKPMSCSWHFIWLGSSWSANPAPSAVLCSSLLSSSFVTVE